MLHLLIVAALFTPVLAISDGAPAAANVQNLASARVPTHPNASCPIMGKPISLKLHTDTPRGRIWVCCKSCIADIHADVELAYRTAYPTERTVESETCPVTGKPLNADSPQVALQGLRFRVFDAAAAKQAVAESQIVVARLLEPKLVDVANALCPIDGKPTSANAFVVIDGRIVRLSTPKHVEQAAKTPAQTLQRALESAKQVR
jgi:hypothetical protein